VLALQLLLLACQAKVHWQLLTKVLQRVTSQVPNLRPPSIQQQQQPALRGRPERLLLLPHHGLLRKPYRCGDADILAAMEQQQQQQQEVDGQQHTDE
jgi:hypothetical protein